MRGYWVPILVLIALYAVVLGVPSLRSDFIGLIASERLLACAFKTNVDGADLATQALCKQATRARPESASVWARAGQLMLGAGAIEEGLEFLRRGAELDSTSRAPRSYSWALAMYGRGDEGLQYYKQLIQRFPDDAAVLNDAGYMLADADEDLELALKVLRRALELDPDSPAIVDSYGWALLKDGKPAEALPFLKWAAQRSPDSPEVQRHLAQAAAKLGLAEEAKEAARRATRPRRPSLLELWLWSFQDHFAPEVPRP